LKIAVIALVVVLSGCAIQGRLIGDGKVYPAETNRSSRSMTATIDGEVYTGSLATTQTFGFGTGFSGGSTGTFTMIGGSNQARGVLISPSNKTIRCEMIYKAVGAQGVCQDSAGKYYDFVSD
jgi:hypothetical protein